MYQDVANGSRTYICPLCRTQIKYREKVKMYHILHEKVLARIAGEYNGIGGVLPNEEFNNTNDILKWAEQSIYNTENDCIDSSTVVATFKTYNGAIVNIDDYIKLKIMEISDPIIQLRLDIADADGKPNKEELIYKAQEKANNKINKLNSKEWHEKQLKSFNKLGSKIQIPKSGLSVMHLECWNIEKPKRLLITPAHILNTI